MLNDRNEENLSISRLAPHQGFVISMKRKHPSKKATVPVVYMLPTANVERITASTILRESICVEKLSRDVSYSKY